MQKQKTCRENQSRFPTGEKKSKQMSYFGS